jgi:hypothetical protein
VLPSPRSAHTGGTAIGFITAHTGGSSGDARCTETCSGASPRTASPTKLVAAPRSDGVAATHGLEVSFALSERRSEESSSPKARRLESLFRLMRRGDTLQPSAALSPSCQTIQEGRGRGEKAFGISGAHWASGIKAMWPGWCMQSRGSRERAPGGVVTKEPIQGELPAELPVRCASCWPARGRRISVTAASAIVGGREVGSDMSQDVV